MGRPAFSGRQKQTEGAEDGNEEKETDCTGGIIAGGTGKV